METKTPKFDYSDIHWQNNGKIKLCFIVGTRRSSGLLLSSPNAANILM